MVKRSSRKGRVASRKGRPSRKGRVASRRGPKRSTQKGGSVPTGYPDMTVSYTPREPGELGSPDAVPRVGTMEQATADSTAAQQP